MEAVTLGAHPEPHLKRKRSKHMSTVVTTLRGWVPFLNLDQRASIPQRFVAQLSHELAPSHVTNGLSQRVVFDHVLDRQILDAYGLVLTNNAGREFVLVVPSPISNLGMDTGDFEAGFVPVPARLLFFGQPPLCLRQFLFILVEELGIANA